MKKETILAHRLMRHGLVSPARDEGEFLELVRRLQPVAPVARAMPGSPPRLMHRCRGDDGAPGRHRARPPRVAQRPVLERQNRLRAGRRFRALRRRVPPPPAWPQQHAGWSPAHLELPRRNVPAPTAAGDGHPAQEADARAPPSARSLPGLRRSERRELGPTLVAAECGPAGGGPKSIVLGGSGHDGDQTLSPAATCSPPSRS